jgi:Domain of unknown function (DUF4157)
MAHSRIHSFSAGNPLTQAKSSQFASRPAIQSQQDSRTFPIQEEIETEAFDRGVEAFGLQLKEKNSSIAPVEQEAQSQAGASRFDRSFAHVPVHAPGRQAPAPMQPPLAIQMYKSAGDRVIQTKGRMTGNRQVPLEERIPNNTGLSDRLKTGIESLSGLAMDDVKVHHNSSKPAELQAVAYTQGSEIHVAPGQEQHLPHEAWHVVQQMQGRVQPTLQAKGVEINDDQGLEHEADVMGTKAVEMVIDSAETPQPSGLKLPSVASLKKVVQKNVGFEFELDNSVLTYQSGRIYGYRSLSKRARILNGIDFYIEADQIPGGSSWEFVTTDFPETTPGLIRLMQVLNTIDGILSVMRNSPLTLNDPLSGVENKIYNPVDNNFAAFGNPVNDRFFTITTTNVKTKPQVTAGFALDALDELYRSATTAAGPGVSNLVRDTNSVDAYGRVPAPQPLDVPLGNMRTAASNAIGGIAPDPALRSLVTQLMQIIIAGRQNIGATPKTIMRLVLGRTDMKAAFNTLPPLIRAPYEATPANFVTLVMNAVNAYLGGVLPNNAPVMSGALFTDPKYANDPLHNMASPFIQVTRDRWLTSIAAPGGQDMLSHGHYPIRTGWFGYENRTDRRANTLLASMGALHGALDPGNRPIFEIRSSREIFAALITPYALDFFKYVRFLHNPGALTESHELTGLAVPDVAAVVGFNPNRALLLQQMQTNALNNFNA